MCEATELHDAREQTGCWAARSVLLWREGRGGAGTEGHASACLWAKPATPLARTNEVGGTVGGKPLQAAQHRPLRLPLRLGGVALPCQLGGAWVDLVPRL